MNKYELLEDMKNNMLTLVGMSEIPTEVKKRLENYSNMLKEIVSKYNSHPENILEYIDMNYGYVESMLERVNDEKINEIASGIMHKCMNMEQRLMENEEENSAHNIEDFRDIIDSKNSNTTDVIIESFSDYIRDVSSRASKMLEYREYSDYTIEEQANEINQLLATVKSLKSQESIFKELEESDKNLVNKVMSLYENYQHSLENNDKSTKERSFREELRNDAPNLEEQKNNSINFLREQEEKKYTQDESRESSALEDSIII